MNYHYATDQLGIEKVRNRLYHVNDLASDTYVELTADGVADYSQITAPPNGLENPLLANTQNNVGYDELGNLVRDDLEQIAGISWTVAGKVKAVDQAAASGKHDLLFHYGADGQRVVKEVRTDAGATQSRDYYIRDAGSACVPVLREQRYGHVQMATR